MVVGKKNGHGQQEFNLWLVLSSEVLRDYHG